MEDTDQGVCCPKMVRQDSGHDSGLDSPASEVSNILSEALNDSRPGTPGTTISRDEDIPGCKKFIPDRTRSAPPSPAPHAVPRWLSSLDDDAYIIFSDKSTTEMLEDSGISRKRSVRQRVQSEPLILVAPSTLSISGVERRPSITCRTEQTSAQSEPSVLCRTEETTRQSQPSISSCIAEPSTESQSSISSRAEQIDSHPAPSSPSLTAKFIITTSKLSPNAACFELPKDFYAREKRDLKVKVDQLITQATLEKETRTMMEERIKDLEGRLETQAIMHRNSREDNVAISKKLWEDLKKTSQSGKDRAISLKHQLAQNGYQIEKGRAAHKTELEALVAAHRIEIEDLKQANQAKTKALEESHESEIKALKAGHHIAIEAAKSDCLDKLEASNVGCQRYSKSGCEREIEAVKTNRQNEIEDIKANCQKEIEAANPSCQSGIEAVKTNYERELKAVRTGCWKEIEAAKTGCQNLVEAPLLELERQNSEKV